MRAEGGTIGAFIPILLMGLIPACLFWSIAKRKGKNQIAWFLIGFIPYIGWIAGIWLASLPDKWILDKMRKPVDKPLEDVDIKYV